MAVAFGVGEAFQDEEAHAFAPARTVGAIGERLATAVGGQTALAAELGEDGGGGHEGDAAGQGEVALARPQRLRGQVERDQ